MGVTGREATLAIGILGTNSWGVATSVTRRVYFDSDAGITSQPTYVDDASAGQMFLGPADVGDFQPVNVTWSGQHYYDHWDCWLEALAMGSPAVTAISSVSATAYQHVMDLSPNTNGLGLTVAADKVLFVEELTSAKVTGFALSFGTGGVLTKSFTFLGAKSINSSTVNSRSIVATAVAPALTKRIYRTQGVLRMNLQSGAALGAGDVVADVTNIGFNYTRPHDTAFVLNQNYTAAPLDNGFPGAELSLSFRQATTASTNSFYALVQAGTALKADLTFTGDYINSTSQRSYKLEFPHLEPQGPFAYTISGAAQATPSMRFLAKLAATSPTSMAIVNPFRLTRVTVNSTTAF